MNRIMIEVLLIFNMFLFFGNYGEVEGLCRNPGKSPGTSMAPNKEIYEEGESIRYICDKSYRMFGEENLVCLRNGSWKDPPPVCMFPMKNQIRQIQLSHAVGDPWVILDGNESTCASTTTQRPRFWKIIFNRHYKIVYFTVLSRVPKDRIIKWHYGLVSRVNNEPPVLLTLDFRDESNKETHFQAVTYDEGVHKPRYAIEFIDNRETDDDFAFCEANIYAADVYECEKLEVPENTIIYYYYKGERSDNTTPLWGTIAVYMCKANFMLNGFPIRNCTENSTWNGVAPKCVPQAGSPDADNASQEKLVVQEPKEEDNTYFIVGIVCIILGIIIAICGISISYCLTRKAKTRQHANQNDYANEPLKFHSSGHGSRVFRISWPKKIASVPSPLYGEESISPYAESQNTDMSDLSGTTTDAPYSGQGYIEMKPTISQLPTNMPPPINKSMESFPLGPPHKPLPEIIMT